MITLCMDTSHIMLALGLIEDDHVAASVQKECWKRQSEEIFPCLIEMMNQTGHKPDDIDQIVISEGPGSYTGVRIAMTVAKVFCAMKEVPLYTIGTLNLYAGLNNCRVAIDARGKRVYTCAFRDGEAVEEQRAEYCEVLKASMTDELIIGDGHLVGAEDRYPDIIQNFLLLKKFWKKAENVHLVVPEYLKSADAYFVKK